jgi:hypothetical protein
MIFVVSINPFLILPRIVRITVHIKEKIAMSKMDFCTLYLLVYNYSI